MRELYYRYDDYLSSGWTDYGAPPPSVVVITLQEFRVVSHTKSGVWLCFVPFGEASKDRWVSNTARKRFACATKEAALESFLARKRKQLLILASQLDRATQAMQKAENMLERLRAAGSAFHAPI